MDWHDRIVMNLGVLAGKPVIKGTRIAVEFVVDLLGQGWRQEQILREYDHLRFSLLASPKVYGNAGTRSVFETS